MNLADGSIWDIVAGNQQASELVSRLKEVMHLPPVQQPTGHLRVLVHDHASNAATLCSECRDSVTCFFKTAENDETLVFQLMWLSFVLSLEVQKRGGVLLHGALAERDGYGVILAGPGGIGKTTASQRLTSPWRSLCDDLTLVVRDQQGIYWAHPWPTWSKFMFGGSGGTWDVQHAVPLKGIFFLAQVPHDQVEPVGNGQAVCLLVESTEQVWGGMRHAIDEQKIRTFRLQRFENLCALAQVIPCYILHLSLNGAFWQEIEKTV
jgi:SynChlorMet cassette protein ScmC